MTGMIEKVGAAIWDKINTATEPSGKCVFTGEDLARAAIEAMAEPTEGMVEAGDNQDDGTDSRAPAAWHWSAMIQAALEGGAP